VWYSTQNHIDEKLNQNMEKKYKTLDLKINKITHHQNKNLDTNTHYYPTVINKTDIQFSNDEMTLLNKGLKYNLTHKGKYWLSNLALEAEAAITILPTHEQEHIRHQAAHNLQKLYKKHNVEHKFWTHTDEMNTRL
jgi:hypothetical protein